MSEIDTYNRFAVSWLGGLVAIANPPSGPMTKADALILAAWLVALADDDDKFAELLEAVQNT